MARGQTVASVAFSSISARSLARGASFWRSFSGVSYTSAQLVTSLANRDTQVTGLFSLRGFDVCSLPQREMFR